MRVVELSHDYPFPADRVWALATDYEALKEVMAGLITFSGDYPEGRAKTGDKANVMTSLFGRFPPQPYYMEVVECDDDNMVMRSDERGMGVEYWRHTVRVEPTSTGARLLDRIEIEAGIMTRAFAGWARFIYKKRHAPRMRMLERGWGL